MYFNRLIKRLPLKKNHIERFLSSKPNFSSSQSRRILLNSFFFIGGSLFGATVYININGMRNVKKEKSIITSVNNSSTLPLSAVDPPVYASDSEIELAIKEIERLFKKHSGEADFSTYINGTKQELDSHSDTYFNSHHASEDERPRFVVYPRSTEDVSDIMKICHKFRVPVVPTSGRSSLEGHFIPTRGGIAIDLSLMDEVVQLNKDDLDIEVQAGVGWETLADYLEDYGLMFSSDPGPGATIAGCCATNASGTNAGRYGETYKNIINLTVVLADGTIIKTKNRPKKSSAGYNLNSLFVGSEGTLGIITEATLKLNVKPKSESVLVVPFPSIKDAANSVNSMILNGLQLNAIELLDDKMMAIINSSGETSRQWKENPTLFLKIGGSNDDTVSSQVKQIQAIVGNHNAVSFEFASDQDERTELWSARKVALWSTINHGKTKNKNIQIWTTDAAVPISKLPQFLTETKEDIDHHKLKNTMVAHIGDGNAHSFILYDPSEKDVAQKVVANMVKRAISYEGTCTGEHGIGLGKREFLVEEVGQLPVDLMRKIKLSLDPLRILNPDKIFVIDPEDSHH